MTEFAPLGSRLVLKLAPTPERVGLLWVPPEAQESTYGISQAIVVAVGPDVRDQRLQPGLRVLCRRFGGFPHNADNTEWSCYERDLYAIVDEDAL
jgi:co-chaperonin GroES (HSP10)